MTQDGIADSRCPLLKKIRLLYSKALPTIASMVCFDPYDQSPQLWAIIKQSLYEVLTVHIDQSSLDFLLI